MRVFQKWKYGVVPVDGCAARCLAPGVRLGVLLCLLALFPDPSPGQVPGRLQDSDEPVHIRWDYGEYHQKSGDLKAHGNVVIRQGDMELRADRVSGNMQTGEIFAVGNVVLRRPGERWTGEELRVNLKEESGGFRQVTLDAPPFRISADHAEKRADGTYLLHQARISTCTNETGSWHYHVAVRELRVLPDEWAKGHGAVWKFGSVPVFYLPYWRRDLNDDFSFRIRPGHDSRLGTFSLNYFRYPISTGLRGRTHLDYRSRRGLGVGQDLIWHNAEGSDFGNIALYYANDRGLDDDIEGGIIEEGDSDRYRVRMDHTEQITDRDYLLLKAHYLSDPMLLEDFFEKEYRAENQPVNYVTLTHRGDTFTASLQALGRLNDFYSQVNRVPEVSLAFLRRQIGETPLYYEGQNSAVRLERVFPQDADEQDTSLFRADTAHFVYWPTRNFGFLNLIPRAGYRATYYSETLEFENSIEGTNTIVRQRNAGEAVRSRTELGLEGSFKAFRTWNHPGFPLRHILEPYADYVYVPEPTILPGELTQYDSVDALDKQHNVRIGARNKLQTKRNGMATDLVNLDLYTTYRIDPDPGQDAIENILMDVRINPSSDLRIEMDANYNATLDQWDTFNSRLILDPVGRWSGELEYRFQNEVSRLLSVNATFQPNRDWTGNAYCRYEFETSQMEEQGGYIQRNLDCIAFRTGFSYIPSYTRTDGTERENEWRVSLEFWLTAFPEIGARGRRSQ